MYTTHQYHSLSVEERNRGGEVKCVAQQHNVQEPAYGTIDLSTDDPRGMGERTSLAFLHFTAPGGPHSCRAYLTAHLPGSFSDLEYLDKQVMVCLFRARLDFCWNVALRRRIGHH